MTSVRVGSTVFSAYDLTKVKSKCQSGWVHIWRLWEEFASKLFQVIDRIQFLVVVGLSPLLAVREESLSSSRGPPAFLDMLHPFIFKSALWYQIVLILGIAMTLFSSVGHYKNNINNKLCFEKAESNFHSLSFLFESLLIKVHWLVNFNTFSKSLCHVT